MIQMTRGIAIVLVCLHHALSQCSNRGIIGQFVYRNIYYVHVVLFFVVSGYLYESKKEKYYSSNLCFIQSKFMRLMVPYLSWQLIIFLFVNIGLSIPVLHNTFVGLGFQHWTFGEFVHNTLFFTNSYVELLWFLYVLFIVFVVNCIFKDKLVSVKALLVLFVVGALFETLMPSNYVVGKIVLHLPNFVLGRVIYKRNIEYKLCSKRMLILAFGLVALFNIESYVSVNVYELPAYFGNLYNIAHSFLQGVCLATVILFTLYYFETAKKSNIISRVLKVVGDYSMEIYLMHNPWIVGLLSMALVKIGANWIIASIVSVFFGCYIPIVIEKYVIERLPLVNTLFFGAPVRGGKF